MTDSWIVIVPALVVLATAIATHNVITSLLIGIASGALLAYNGEPIGAATTIVHRFWSIITDTDTLFLFGFLVCLGALIEIMTASGGIAAYTRKLRAYVATPRTAETMPLLLSWLFFLDDWLNGLTVGAIMRPLTDALRVPRIKLAYLVNTIGAPMALIVPATTWMAMILGQFDTAGISDVAADTPRIMADPLKTYVMTIPYMIYPVAIIVAAWFIVQTRISFGLMAHHEITAQTTGNLFGGKPARNERTASNEAETSKASVWSFLIPIVSFVGFVLIAMLVTGDAAIIGGSAPLITALKQADSSLSLCAASALAILLSAINFLGRGVMTPSKFFAACKEGFGTMKGSIILLTLAYTFSDILMHDLHAGAYLAGLVSSALPLWLLPFLVFCVATAITAATGSSWGTIAITTPLTVSTLVGLAPVGSPVPLSALPLLYPVLGALFAGSCAGSHISPITDSTVMGSTSTNAYHMDHVISHAQYSLPTVCATGLGFLFLGWSSSGYGLTSLGITYGLVIGISLATLLLCSYLFRPSRNAA